MNVITRLACQLRFPAVLLFVALFRLHSWGQALPGDNAVYNTQGGVTNSHAFIDASQVPAGSQDVCAKINAALMQAAANPLVYNAQSLIDARGLTNLACSMNPWGTSAPANGWPAAIILLPAGTITIPTTWTVPTYNRIIGEGSGISILQANPSTFSGTPMALISMGIYPQTDSIAVIIEHLGLNASGHANVIGIANYYSQELSRVNDVAIAGIASGGIGLDISGPSSGPYTNIYVAGSGGCARITARSDTRGIHGLTCNTTGMVCQSGSNSASVCLDGTNNTIEDLTLTGTSTDGILVGSASAAQGNVLLNVSGGSGQTNVIELSNNVSNGQANATDVTILGATGPGGTVNTIKDDLDVTSLTDGTVGLYVVGEQMFTGAYSRLTTSTSLPTWLIGQNSPSSGCAIGDLYSAISPGTFWGCVSPGSWSQILTH